MDRGPPSNTHYPGTIPNDPRADVWLPATFLMIVGVINGLLALVILVLSITGASLQMLGGYAPEALMGGTTALLNGAVGLALSGLIVFGGIKMKSLESWALVLVACVAAMIPCTSPCYILGIPAGIWAMMIIFSPEVKSAFRS